MEIGTTKETTESTAPTNLLEKSGLDQQAFLKLFLAQLENQDPLNPQDSTELSAQLAQFSQFEQSLRMVEELKSINTRLEEILEATKSQETGAIDPAALLGREIEFVGSQVKVGSSGTAPALHFDLPETAQALGLVARDAQGNSIGQALLPPVGEDRSVALSAGLYALEIGPTGPRLVAPSGTVETIDFVRTRREADGAIQVELDADGNPVPLTFDPGRTYGFAIGATTLSGQPLELSTTTTGLVEAVNNTSGSPTVIVNGQELELTQVIRIRN